MRDRVEFDARDEPMPENDFDIYQTESGYTAVTNAVRRTILDALAQKDRRLPDQQERRSPRYRAST